MSNTIYTKWIAYNGRVGVTEDAEFYDLKEGIILKRECHQGAIYYRAHRSKNRYSRKKIDDTKKLCKIEVIIMPF